MMMHAFTWMQMASKSCFRMGFAASHPVPSTRTSLFETHDLTHFLTGLKTTKLLKKNKGATLFFERTFIEVPNLFIRIHEGTPCN